MSCHDIGRGMNSVVKVVIELLDSKCLDSDVAKAIIVACRKGVHWCDGNEDEAIESIRRCRCGNCMKVVDKGDFLFSVWNASPIVLDLARKRGIDVLDYRSDHLASDGLCLKCFDEVINEFCGDEQAGPNERAYIMQHRCEDEYLSEG